MITALRRRLDRLRGAGESSVTIPSMDGAFRPNSLLDTAEIVAQLEAPDDLASDGARVVVSAGSTLLALADDDAEPIRTFEAAITCLAGHPCGLLAAGLADQRIVILGGPHDGKVLAELGGQRLICPTALGFADAGTLLVCLGSCTHAPAEWKRDLMERGTSGSVWRVDLDTGRADCLGAGLGYPYGIAPLRSGGVLVSEAWRHRLVALEGGAPRTVLGDLPGYPGRIAAGENDDRWLCLFAPRRQMVEFVLRERAYCNRMMREVPEPFWMAPALSSGHSFEEPLQGGAVKHLGIHKPWAPTRSYGLLVRLDAACTPLASAHSRADGRHHGLTGVLVHGRRVLAASQGGDAVISLDPATISEE